MGIRCRSISVRSAAYLLTPPIAISCRVSSNLQSAVRMSLSPVSSQQSLATMPEKEVADVESGLETQMGTLSFADDSSNRHSALPRSAVGVPRSEDNRTGEGGGQNGPAKKQPETGDGGVEHAPTTKQPDHESGTHNGIATDQGKKDSGVSFGEFVWGTAFPDRPLYLKLIFSGGGKKIFSLCSL